MTSILDSVYEEEIRIWIRTPAGKPAHVRAKSMTSGRGLAAHPEYGDWQNTTPLGKYVGIWNVTHVGSGHALPCGFYDLDAALRFMARIDSLVDWKQTMAAIVKINAVVQPIVCEVSVAVGGFFG